MVLEDFVEENRQKALENLEKKFPELYEEKIGKYKDPEFQHDVAMDMLGGYGIHNKKPDKKTFVAALEFDIMNCFQRNHIWHALGYLSNLKDAKPKHSYFSKENMEKFYDLSIEGIYLADSGVSQFSRRYEGIESLIERVSTSPNATIATITQELIKDEDTKKAINNGFWAFLKKSNDNYWPMQEHAQKHVEGMLRDKEFFQNFDYVKGAERAATIKENINLDYIEEEHLSTYLKWFLIQERYIEKLTPEYEEDILSGKQIPSKEAHDIGAKLLFPVVNKVMVRGMEYCPEEVYKLLDVCLTLEIKQTELFQKEIGHVFSEYLANVWIKPKGNYEKVLENLKGLSGSEEILDNWRKDAWEKTKIKKEAHARKNNKFYAEDVILKGKKFSKKFKEAYLPTGINA